MDCCVWDFLCGFDCGRSAAGVLVTTVDMAGRWRLILISADAVGPGANYWNMEE